MVIAPSQNRVKEYLGNLSCRHFWAIAFLREIPPDALQQHRDSQCDAAYALAAQSTSLDFPIHQALLFKPQYPRIHRVRNVQIDVLVGVVLEAAIDSGSNRCGWS